MNQHFYRHHHEVLLLLLTISTSMSHPYPWSLRVNIVCQVVCYVCGAALHVKQRWAWQTQTSRIERRAGIAATSEVG